MVLQGEAAGSKKKHKILGLYIRKMSDFMLYRHVYVVRKDLSRDMEFFDTGTPACEDYRVWLRFCFKYEVILIPEPLTIKKVGGRRPAVHQAGSGQVSYPYFGKMLNSAILNTELI